MPPSSLGIHIKRFQTPGFGLQQLRRTNPPPLTKTLKRKIPPPFRKETPPTTPSMQFHPPYPQPPAPEKTPSHFPLSPPHKASYPNPLSNQTQTISQHQPLPPTQKTQHPLSGPLATPGWYPPGALLAGPRSSPGVMVLGAAGAGTSSRASGAGGGMDAAVRGLAEGGEGGKGEGEGKVAGRKLSPRGA